MKFSLNVKLLFMISFCSNFTLAEESSDKIEIHYEEQQDSDEMSESNSVFGLFDNPVLANGLDNAATAINRGVDTLMESLFYDLMDNDFTYWVNDNYFFETKLNRELYDTPKGNYVVVDTISLGPGYTKEFFRVNEVPFTLNANIEGNLLHMYLRSDAQRVSESKEDDFFSYSLKNWFGVLPALSYLLPPSFNPNELYDPLNYFKIPFNIPLSAESFKDIKVGHIYSYSLAGTLSIPLDIGAPVHTRLESELEKIQNFKITAPFSLSVSGEHRINILKKSETIAWLGISRVSSYGPTINATIGNVIKIFSNTIPYWSGLPLKLFPLDLVKSILKQIRNDTLYEYDLTTEKGREAYNAAVLGDFQLSKDYIKHFDDNVKFHFNKVEDGIVDITGKNHNLVIFGSENHLSNSTSEVRISDSYDINYFLKTSSIMEDSFSNLLVGSEKERFGLESYISVNKLYSKATQKNKETRKTNPSSYIYVYKNLKNPYEFQINYHIQDKYLDTLEYKEAIQNLELITNLNLSSLPKIPTRDQDRLDAIRSKRLMLDPSMDQVQISVPPTYLGKFNATASIYFHSESIDKLTEVKEDKIWRSFAEAYGIDPGNWDGINFENSHTFVTEWLKYAITLPANLFGFEITQFKAIREANAKIKAIKKLRSTLTPIARQAVFSELLTTYYPVQLIAALLKSIDNHFTPRKVTFHTKAKGKANHKTKSAFGALNKKTIKSSQYYSRERPELISYEKLSAFYPASQEFDKSGISIKTASIFTERPFIPMYGTDPVTRLILELEPSNPLLTHINLYIKVEESGKLSVGKFLLAEEIINIDAVYIPGKKLPKFQIYLNGEKSPIQNLLKDYSFSSGGEFTISFAISSDNINWSDTKKVSFRYQAGALLPVK